MLNLLRRLWKDEEGQGLIEYALIAVFISIVAIAALQLINPDLLAIWNKIRDGVDEGAKAAPTPE